MAKVDNLLTKLDESIYELAFVISGAATLASLVLSNILDYPPCDLCWYQRILMFPLPVIFGVAILRRDKLAYLYVWPMIAVGAALALYQSLLQWGVITETSATCSLTSISCADPAINWFGFLTIPFGALMSFVGLGWLMWRQQRQVKPAKFAAEPQNRLLKLLVGIIGVALISIALILTLQNTKA